MIRLAKGAPPAVLVKEGARWTSEYVGAVEAGGPVSNTIRFRYRHPDVKHAIVSETQSKCAYCESKITHADPGETDHIRPVSIYPELILDWLNLTFVCNICNRNKGNFDSAREPIVNPYNDDPDQHLFFAGPMVFHVPGDMKGKRTVSLLDLNRLPLIERRAETLQRILPLIEQWNGLPSGPTKDLIRREILSTAADDAEFASAMRWFLRQHHHGLPARPA